MNDLSAILTHSVDRFLADIADCPLDDAKAWQSIEEMGLPALFLPESDGGMQGSWSDAHIVLQSCGYHALPFPVGETMIGNRLLQEHEMEPATGMLALGIGKGRMDGGDRFDGHIDALSPVLPGNTMLAQVALEQGEACILLDTGCTAGFAPSSNAAGEPRGGLTVSDAPVRQLRNVAPGTLFRLGAFLRSCQISGALAACLERTTRYAGERSQFGRELRQFQAIQHQIALLAEETAAIASASASAAQALDYGIADFAIACAKLRANMATGSSALIAHQVHGAIGITEEYALHRYTRRLWAWRSEFGNDRHWARELGKMVLAHDGDTAWEFLTKRRA